MNFKRQERFKVTGNFRALKKFENLLADQEVIDKQLTGALVKDDEEAFLLIKRDIDSDNIAME